MRKTMEIKTKFSIGQKVCISIGGQFFDDKIERIEISEGWVKYGCSGDYYLEEVIFSEKEALEERIERKRLELKRGHEELEKLEAKLREQNQIQYKED